jgi:hypothetical protein
MAAINCHQETGKYKKIHIASRISRDYLQNMKLIQILG